MRPADAYWYLDRECTILHCTDGSSSFGHETGKKEWWTNGNRMTEAALETN